MLSLKDWNDRVSVRVTEAMPMSPTSTLSFTKDSLKEHPAWSRFRMINIHILSSPVGLVYSHKYCVGIWSSPIWFWRAGQPRPLRTARLRIKAISQHADYMSALSVLIFSSWMHESDQLLNLYLMTTFGSSYLLARKTCTLLCTLMACK